MSRLTRDGTAEPVSRDHILRRERGQRKKHFPCSADHKQYWQPHPLILTLAICDDRTYIHNLKMVHTLVVTCIMLYLPCGNGDQRFVLLLVGTVGTVDMTE